MKPTLCVHKLLQCFKSNLYTRYNIDTIATSISKSYLVQYVEKNLKLFHITLQ